MNTNTNTNTNKKCMFSSLPHPVQKRASFPHNGSLWWNASHARQGSPSFVVLKVMLTRSLGDDTSQKDLVFAMLMSTGDGNIKADWQKVEKIMISWGYNFTIGAMCKSSCLDVPTCGFLSFHACVAYASIGSFTRRPHKPSNEAMRHHAAMLT